MTKPAPSAEHPSCLWLTRFYPYPPYAGDKIYTARLIEALAALDCTVTVLCSLEAVDCASEPPKDVDQRIEWIRKAPSGSDRAWAYPISSLPRQALALATPTQRAAVEQLLRRQSWSVIVIDSVTMGWVLPQIETHWPDQAKRPPLIYLSHNHEASLRRTAARESSGSLLKRLALRLDAKRVAALEARLLAAAALVTVNTQADRRLYENDDPKQRYEVLVPGYDGPVAQERLLTADTPRRVVVVGSFGWLVKRQNLCEFLEAAAAPLAARGIGIDIVGSGPTGFLDRLRRWFPQATIHGQVAQVEPYLAAARISVVPERVGGGFKHKVLNAVFQRIPIFALSESITELPLDDGQSVRLCPGFHELVAAIIAEIDDLERLNSLQRNAFAACVGRFDWGDRGRRLRMAIDRLIATAPGDGGRPTITEAQ